MKKTFWVFLLVFCLFLFSGCTRDEGQQTDIPEMTPGLTATPMPEVHAEPAKVISGRETDQKVISLIFEGYTDTLTIETIGRLLVSRQIPAVFFFSGVVADEHPEVLRELANMRFDIGNYGMSGSKHLQTYPAYKNAEWFEKTQRLIEKACAVEPGLVRCNGTEMTEDVLKAVTAAGLKAAVVPTAYVNHRSFTNQGDADGFVSGLLRGSILSVKLGQELDSGEFGDAGHRLDERPAIDPSPGIRRDWNTEESPYASIPEIVGWLTDSLISAGYSFVLPEELETLESAQMTVVRELREGEIQELDVASYPVPVTSSPLEAGAWRKGTLDNSVFVGDSVMAGVGNFVSWKRKTEPGYLGSARFLTEERLTIESAIRAGDAGRNAIEDRIGDSASVYLCLGFSQRSAYTDEKYLANYRLLIRRIQEKHPGTRIVIMTMLPGTEGHQGIGNEERFAYNLMLCKMCRMYGIGFVDAAFAVRDETGNLRDAYCLDRATYGTHLNDQGCEALLTFITEHVPDSESLSLGGGQHE